MIPRPIQIAMIGFLGVVLVYGAGYWFNAERQRVADEYRIAEKVRVDNWITEQKRSLVAGEQDYVNFYSTCNTDYYVIEFSGMSEIKDLGFEQTDLSDEGLRHVAALPDLRELTLQGPQHINSSGLQLLRDNPTLRVLQLVHAGITDKDLAILESLPKLVELELLCESHRSAELTDGALVHLRELSQLKTLVISGGWMSDETLAELRDALPDCKVETNTRH